MKAISLIFALWGLSGLLATAQSCCPNGTYTGDLIDACLLTPSYGYGKCYGNYQINGDTYYAADDAVSNAWCMGASRGQTFN
jgi:hypothetical protein